VKKFNIKKQIGKARYIVSYHDGIKKHPDGSELYDIAIFKSKMKMTPFVLSLLDSGYINE